MKNENDSLKNQIDLISKERDFVFKEENYLKIQFDITLKENEKLHISLNKFKNDFDSCKSFCNANIVSSSIDKNEICVLKKKINYLDSTLSQYAFDHKIKTF